MYLELILIFLASGVINNAIYTKSKRHSKLIVPRNVKIADDVTHEYHTLIKCLAILIHTIHLKPYVHCSCFVVLWYAKEWWREIAKREAWWVFTLYMSWPVRGGRPYLSWQLPSWSTGARFNIKMPSYQYRKSHCGDKTAVRSSYLHNGIVRCHLYIESGPRSFPPSANFFHWDQEMYKQ